jgi:hypothetical protein
MKGRELHVGIPTSRLDPAIRQAMIALQTYFPPDTFLAFQN